MIIVAANTRGRTPTRGKSNARPLSSGMEIINFTRHAGRWTPILRDLSGISFARVRGVVAGMQHPGHCTSFLFSGLPRFKPLQKSLRCLANRLHVSRRLLSFAPASQVQTDTGASACPTQDGSHPTRNRVSI